MKKWQSILVVFVLLIVLIVAYLYIKQNPKASDEAESTSIKESTKIELSNLNSDDITKIELISTERELIIARQGDNWTLNSDSRLNPSKSIIDTMASNLASISSDLLVEENVVEFSAYGLDNPHKAIVTLKDGQTHTFLMGNQTPTGEGYYFMKAGEKTVYMVGSRYKSIFYYNYQDLVEKEQIPNIDAEKLNYLYINQKGKPEIEIIRPEDETLNKYELWNSLAAWKITKPYKLARGIIANDDWTAIMQATTGFNTSVRAFVEPDPLDLSVYGLSEPELELLFKDSDGVETHLYFGTETENSTIYFKQADSSDVYTMSTSAVEQFKDMNLFSITDKFVSLFNIEDLDKLTIQSGDEITEFDITVTKTKEGEGDDARDITTISCKVGDKEYPEADFKKLYQNFIGISVDTQYNGEPVSGTPDISIKFSLSDGTVIEPKFYEYDDKYYIFSRDGVQEFLVNKRQFDNLFKRMTDFFDGKISESN